MITSLRIVDPPVITSGELAGETIQASFALNPVDVLETMKQLSVY